MTPDEKIDKMTKAINGAIHVMEHPFESTKEDVARAVLALKNSIAREIVVPSVAPAAKSL